MDLTHYVKLILELICIGVMFFIVFWGVGYVFLKYIEYSAEKEQKKQTVEMITAFDSKSELIKKLNEWFEEHPKQTLENTQIQFMLDKYQSAYLAIIIYEYEG